MTRIAEALRAATAQLSKISDTARLDAELLMAEALGVSRSDLLLAHMEAEVPDAFTALVARRAAHEPIAYILGRRDFWTIEIGVGPGVLVPRPDSETLIVAAVDHFGATGPTRVLDLGTGPGSLLLAALDQWPGATGLGVDRSARALGFARANAERLGLAARAAFRDGDWGVGLDERFDLILCNPPYVESEASLPPDVALWEPAEALFAGRDGLDDYRRLAPMLSGLLAERGIACVEIGAGQAAAVTALFAGAGLAVRGFSDLGGITRCLRLSAG